MSTEITVARPPVWARWAPAGTWLVVGVSGWWALATALEGRSASAVWALGVLVSATWVGVFVATLVPSSVSLTVVRWVSPLAPLVAIDALIASADAAAGAVAVAVGVAHCALVATAEVGRAYVQTSAYGDEDRFPLRLPAKFALPLVVTWVVWGALVAVAVYSLADGAVWLGIVLTVVVAAVSLALLPRFHRLSKRWLVVLPGGVVLHDPVVLGETLMVTRANLAGMRLALADTEAADLTGPAAGHAVEVTVKEMVTALVPPSREHPNGRAMHVQSFLAAPTRPGQALATAAARRHPVG
jgi:hypothetical protein